MRMPIRSAKRICFLSLVALAVTHIELQAQCVQVPNRSPAYCDTLFIEEPEPPPGAGAGAARIIMPIEGRKPLILVHGIFGTKEAVFEGTKSASNEEYRVLINRLLADPGFLARFKIYRYHYRSNTHSVMNIGRALADRLAEIPSDAMVTIVAHSMGGLVSRAAMDMQSTRRTGPWMNSLVGDRVEKLVTLATPHHGSLSANESARDCNASPEVALAMDVVERWLYRETATALYLNTISVREANRSDLVANDYLLNLAAPRPCKGDPPNQLLRTLSGRFHHKISAYYGDLADCRSLEECDEKMLRAGHYLQLSFEMGWYRPFALSFFTSYNNITKRFNDGAVENNSGAFSRASVARRLYCPKHTHSDMQGSSQKTCSNGLTVSESVLREIVPATIVSGPIINILPAAEASTPVFVSTPIDVRVANHGQSPLQVSSISLTGTNAADFSITTPLQFHIGPGAASTVRVNFRPTSTGPRSVSLVVTSNATNAPTISVPLPSIGIAAGGSCVPALSSPMANIAASGGAGLLTVTTTANCRWTARQSAPWISILAPPEGVGLGTQALRYSLSANTGSTPRFGSIAIAGGERGATLQIVQDAATTGCSLALSPSSMEVPSSGGVLAFTVLSGSSCQWSASSNTPWIATGTSGMKLGPQSVSFTVPANTAGSFRAGSIAIQLNSSVPPLLFQVTQEGSAASSCSYILAPEISRIAHDQLSGTFSVQTGNTCPWTASSLEPWIRVQGVASGTGAGTVSFTTLLNSSTSPRRGLLSIEGRGQYPAHYVEQGGRPQQYPSLSITSTSLDLGSIMTGTIGYRSFLVTNSGPEALHLGTLRVDPPTGPFSVSNTVSVVPPGESGMATVAFSPTSLGVRNATLLFSTNDPTRPEVQIALQGTGGSPGSGGSDFQWSSKAPPPEPRTSSAVVALGAQLYVFGGGAVRRNHRYDATLNSWSPLAETPIGSSNQSAAIWNNQVYVLGEPASAPRTGSTIVLKYDPNSNNWSEGPFLPVAHAGGTLAAANGRLYAFTLGGVFELDLGGTTWSKVADLRSPRILVMTAVLGARIILVGGIAGGNTTSLTESFDPVSRTWSEHDPIPIPVRLGATSVLNGKLYVLGGLRDQNPRTVSSVQEFDLARTRTNPLIPVQWTAKASLGTARFGAVAGVINGKIYVAGGSNAETFVNLPPTEEGALAVSPQISVNTANIQFATTPVGLISSLALSVQNSGSASLSYSLRSPGDLIFTAVENTEGVIPPGQSVTVSLRFSPTTPGLRNGTFQILSNDPSSPLLSIPVTGWASTLASLPNAEQILFEGPISSGVGGNPRFIQFLGGSLMTSRESPAALVFQRPDLTAAPEIISLASFSDAVPEQISVQGSLLYVPASVQGSEGRLIVVNRETKQVVASVPAGLSPIGSAVLGSTLYVTDNGCRSGGPPAVVRRYNTLTNAALPSINVAGAAGLPAVDQYSQRVFVPVPNCPGGSPNLTVIDGVDGNVLSVIPMLRAPRAAVVRDGKVYVTTSSSLEVFNITSGAFVQSIALPERTVAIAQSNQYLFLSGTFGSRLYVVSPVSDTIVATIPLSTTAFLAADPETDRFFMLASDGRSVLRGRLSRPDFAVSSSAPLLYAAPASTASVETSLQLFDGYARSGINRECQNLPNGVSCTILDVPQTPADVAASRWRFNITVNTGALSPGNYSFRFVATDSSFSRSVTISVAIPTCQVLSNPASVSLPVGGGTTPLGLAVTNGCRWTALSSAAWLTFASPQTGVGNASVTVSAAPNPTSSARVASITVGGTTIPVSQAGSTASPTFSMSQSTLTIGPALGQANVSLTASSADASWSASSNAPWLTVAPSSGSGSALLSVGFLANAGLSSRVGEITAGGQRLTVVQSGSALPSVDGTPPLGKTSTTEVFTLQFSHPEGFQKLGVLNILINKALDGANACYIAFSQPSGVLYLVDDEGPEAGLSVPLVLGTNSSVGNTQCRVNGVDSSASGSGTNFSLRLSITFHPVFAGSQVIYLAARDQVTGNSGWQTKGFHQIPGAPVSYPRPIDIAPATGTATNSTLSFSFEDQISAGNIRTAWALVNTALDGSRGCYVSYYAPDNLLFLFPDDGNGTNATMMPLIGTGNLQNSQCRIDAQGSSVVKNGPRMTLNLNMTFRAAFTGPKAIWIALQTITSVTSAWQVAGAWQVPP